MWSKDTGKHTSDIATIHQTCYDTILRNRCNVRLEGKREVEMQMLLMSLCELRQTHRCRWSPVRSPFLSVLRSAWLAQLGDLKTPNYLDHINGWQRLNFVIKVKQLVSIHKDPKSLVLAMDLNLYKWGKDRRESAKWDQIKRILCQSLRHIVNSVLKGNACLTLHDCLSQLNSDPFFGSPSAQITNNKHSLSSSIFTHFGRTTLCHTESFCDWLL